MKKYLIKILILIAIVASVLLLIFFITSKKKESVKLVSCYISSSTKEVSIYDDDKKEILKLVRGIKVSVYKEKLKDDSNYKKIKYNNNTYYINSENIVEEEKNIIKETEMYVRTDATIYKDLDSSAILSLAKKGSKLFITGFDKINSDGSVNRYKVKNDTVEGYVYAKYLVSSLDESMSLYDKNGLQEYLSKMGNTLGGGTATSLDYYPYEKGNFSNNKMPDEVRALYINSVAVRNIDEYIDFAVNNNINAFVIDIKDNTTPAYSSEIMLKYSKTNYDHALNSFEDYASYVKKAKDAGIYLIGRITTFKDSYYVEDHRENAIVNSNGEPFNHNGSYWPSAYKRGVWEFNVELAKEAVVKIGFNEIQFDYVRFPDRTGSLEKNGAINLGNDYGEEKAQAIQNFIMYACDEIHSVGAYVSIDVFGESASDYVTAYGQFWPAISNVADVISGMPYPDHFNAHEYGIKEVVWTVPYTLLNSWSKYVVSKQEIIPTPAIVRTWIQTYNTTKTPSVVYDSNKISDEIQALYDNGLKGGFMTWNSASNLVKYKEVSYSFKKVY